MALSTYSDLQTAVGEWLAKSNLSARAPDFIRLAESHLNRTVRVQQNRLTATQTVLAGSWTTGMPTGALEVLYVAHTDTGDEVLPAVPINNVEDFYPMTNAGRPTRYAIANSTIGFNRVLDQDYTFLISYYKKWDIETDLTNWLLTNAPDAYLFASLAEAADYQRNDAALAKYVARRDAAVQSILNANSSNRRAILTVDPALRGRGAFDIETGL